MKKLLALVLAAALLLTGCHGHLVSEGAERAESYTLPESFDTSRHFEITFWAKTTPTRSRPPSIKRQSRIFRSSTPISP